MSTKTTNLEMTLLAEEDNFDTNVYNENFQKTDDKIGELNSMLGSEELTTTSQTHSGAINELNKNIGIIESQLFQGDGGFWIPAGKYILIVDYNVVGDENVIIETYDYTSKLNLGYAYTAVSNGKNVRNNIVRVVELTTSSQIGVKFTDATIHDAQVTVIRIR